jgi:hypothetical protein
MGVPAKARVVSREGAGWLLFLFSLPAKQAAQRVDLWRKLRRYGALPLPTSGYLLPNTPAHRERFEWLAAAVRKYRGDASVAHVRAIDDLPEERLRQLFREARTKDYEALIRAAKKVRGKDAGAKVARLRRLLLEIVTIDFFNSPLRSRAESLLAETNGAPAAHGKRSVGEFRGRTWVTRHRPGIDRVSSAWLIRRFIDPEAKFTFADSPQEQPAGIPYDMFRSAKGFGHRGNDCTFETLAKEFVIRDRKVQTIAQIVHDADLADARFGRTEGAGLDRVLIGWAQQGVPDEELLRRGMELIEGLYESL